MGDIRLSNGYSATLEIFQSGKWVPVANTAHSWTQDSSNVVCNELGYSSTGVLIYDFPCHL